MARRRFQKGSVVLKGENWFARFYEDIIKSCAGCSQCEDWSDYQKQTTPHRIRRSALIGSTKQYPTESLASRRLPHFLSRINSLDYRAGREATIAEFAEKWKQQVVVNLKPSTQHGYLSHLHMHIIPMLGKLRIDQIGIENQQIFVNRLAPTVSRTTMMNILATLSTMLRTAHRWKYSVQLVDKDCLVIPPKKVKTKGAHFTPKQATEIYEAATGQLRIMCAIAAMTALRIGEILGLQVGDVDLINCTLRIERSVWRGMLQTPKTEGSIGSMPIPENLKDILLGYLATLPATQKFLFVNAAGKVWKDDNLRRRHLGPLLKSLHITGFSRCGFHAFRHMHATAVMTSGAPSFVWQAQLRHSDPRMAMEAYAHVHSDQQRAAAENVSKLLGMKVDAPIQ